MRKIQDKKAWPAKRNERDNMGEHEWLDENQANEHKQEKKETSFEKQPLFCFAKKRIRGKK